MSQPTESIALVICQILRSRLTTVKEGIKLYIQGVQSDCVARSVELIQADPVLRDVVEIHLSRRTFQSLGVAEAFLTDSAVGDFRNEELQDGRKIMLLGPPDESEWDTIRTMKALGEEEIMAADDAWVQQFAPATMDAKNKTWWRAALRGLHALSFAKLDEFAAYATKTESYLTKGELLPESLGKSLPALRLPTHSFLFAINEPVKGQMSKWRDKFKEHKRKAQCYLFKKDRNDEFIENENLEAALTEYRTQPDHDANLANIFEEYVKADYMWSAASEKIAEFEWNIVGPTFFEKVSSKAAQNLGADTALLFDSQQTMPDLPEEDRATLKQLAESRAKGEPTEAEKGFFRRFYREMQSSPTLFSRWESYILEKSVEDSDFVCGLLRCLRLLRPKNQETPWQIVVRAKAVKAKDLYQLNEDTAVFFATRYEGLKALLTGAIKFVGFENLLNYPTLIREWKSDVKIKKHLRTGKPSRSSCQLVFYVELESDNKRQIKLVWRFNPVSLSANLRDDISRLAESKTPFVASTVSRETSGRRAVPLDLSDINSLQPAYGHTSGTLIPATDKLKDIRVRDDFETMLGAATAAGQISEDRKEELLLSFDQFSDAYKEALEAFLASGVSAFDKIQVSADAYGKMLDAASAEDMPDIVLGGILPHLLAGSTVSVESYGSQYQPTVIVPPWHPLRLLAIAAKAKQFAALAKQLTSGSAKLSDVDGDLLFRDTMEWHTHVYYPEVVIRLQGKQPRLLSVCQNLQDYSVHELPVKPKDLNVPTDINPRESALQIGKIVAAYLELQPHERDNLSVVLFDCDSEQLPAAVVEEIRDLSEEDDQDAMCQVLIAHSNKVKLRALYRTLSKSTESADTFNSSEATRDFMARLRINIMVADQGPQGGRLQHPYDIVFAENTISRHSTQTWDSIVIDQLPAAEVKPSTWSRRKPMSSGAINSSVYLVSPSAPLAVWQYLKAVAYSVDPENARKVEDGSCRVPLLSLGLNDESVGRLIDSMHSLGSWVVNYDELLHRKLLENKGIRIIRYKQTSTQGKNLIISSKAKDGMLRTELKKLCAKFLPETDDSQRDELANRLIREANNISGNLVLRAIRRSENAKELMGLVLSKFLITHELGSGRHHGWFLLDDYADWLGEDEAQIADILCLSPVEENEKEVLDIFVTEAKFVENAGVGKKARESRNQLKQSLSRLEGGLQGDEVALDRSIWLARISDMIVDGVDAPAIAKFDAAEWRRKIRSGQCTIRIKGYSHVFDAGPEQVGHGAPTAISNTANGQQAVFSLHQTSALLRAFFEGTAPPDRDDSGGESPFDPPSGDGGAPSTPFAEVESPMNWVGEPPTPPPAPEPIVEPDSANSSEVPVPDDSASVPADGDSLLAWLNAPLDKADVDDATLAWVETTTLAARKALISYEMPAELSAQAILTPNSLLLSFKGSDRLTATGLEKKRSELLTTHGLKVVAIRPHSGSVRVYLERPERQVVPLRSFWKSWLPTVAEGGNTNLLFAVREEDSSPVYLNPLKQSPHTLVAGTSGSGKSVLMQSLLLGIAATNTPQQANIILIDPKLGSDYGPLRRLPHVKLITTTEEALTSMSALVTEMDRRYQLMSESDVNHINLYNEQAEEKLPYIWLIHDEFALWMQRKEYRDEVVQIGNQLAIMARAAGIFLVFAAQRPSVDVMPMQMRDNLDNRLILRVVQEGTSDFCLGEGGAEKLLMRGQMLAKLGGDESILCQVPFASIEEIKQLCVALLARYPHE